MTRHPPAPACPMGGGACVYPCDKLRHAHLMAGLSHDAVSRQLGVHRATWHRYRIGRQQPARAVCVALASMQGYLAVPGWAGWQFVARQQQLYHPELAVGFTAAEVTALAYRRSTLFPAVLPSPIPPAERAPTRPGAPPAGVGVQPSTGCPQRGAPANPRAVVRRWVAGFRMDLNVGLGNTRHSEVSLARKPALLLASTVFSTGWRKNLDTLRKWLLSGLPNRWFFSDEPRYTLCA